MRSKVVARLCLWLVGQESPVFKTYWDLGSFQVDLDRVVAEEGWIRLDTGDVPGCSFHSELKASAVSRYKMEVFS